MPKTKIHSPTFDPAEMRLLLQSLVRFGGLISQLGAIERSDLDPLVSRLVTLCGAMTGCCVNANCHNMTLQELRDLESMIYHIDTLCRRFNDHYPDEESRMRYAIVDAIYRLKGFAYQKKDRYGTRAAERREQTLNKQRAAMEQRQAERRREKYGDPDGGTNA